MKEMRRIAGAACLALVVLAGQLITTGFAADKPTFWQSTQKEDYTIDRTEIFEFTQKPTVSKEGDRVTIRFASKAYCDATVAIEQKDGKILRHLASGCLGPNAPEPFQKDSLEQAVVWDGKNDLGKYVDDLTDVHVRVSLGLKPQFEKTLLWHPKKVCSLRRHPRAVAQPEGVYVYDGGGVEQVKLFSHEGKYIRTVYPFPADKVEQVKGLKWHTFADGHKAPAHRGYWGCTYLSGGTGVTHSDWGTAATSFAVQNDRIAVVPWSRKKGLEGGLNRFRTDGTTGDLSLNGPKINTPYPAESAAFSPDGKWLYLAGIYRQIQANYMAMPPTVRFRHEVYRMAYAGNEPPTRWLGGKTGKGGNEFDHPASVCVDAKGRVYVADNQNDRVQVFSPEGKLVKSVPVNGPFILQIHHKTQELYVFSWTSDIGHMPGVKRHGARPMLRVFDPFKSNKPKQEIPIPFAWKVPAQFNDGMPYRVALDSYTDPVTIWAIRAGGHRHISRDLIGYANWELFTIEKGKLVRKQAWDPEVAKAIVKTTPPSIYNQRLLVDPATGLLYSLEATHYVNRLYRIDPDSGRVQAVPLPYKATDVTIDYEGHVLLRNDRLIGRFTLKDRREVPFDYGEERGGLRSGIVLPGNKPGNWIEVGMDANPKGEIAVFVVNSTPRWKPTRGAYFRRGVDAMTKKYVPGIFRGRQRYAEIHILDRHGKVVAMDAVGQGAPDIHELRMDPNGDVYLLVSKYRTYDGKAFHGHTGCLIKFKRGKGRFLSTHGEIGLPKDQYPKVPQQIREYWVQDAEWIYPGVGFSRSRGPCVCWRSGFALDTFGRSFIPERVRSQVAVLDTNGNLILHVGKYGNVDDGVPLVPDRYRTQKPRSVGGDEVALMHVNFTGVHSDHRLFIADTGNGRILSVKLGYHTTERLPLKNEKGQN
jgi:hypothetical protein